MATQNLPRNISAIKSSSVTVHLEWEPFMLNPQMSDNGENIKEYLSRKYGVDRVKGFDSKDSYLNQAGKKAGITFMSERKVYPTVMAHALMEHMKKEDNEKANKLMENMYRKYFEFGQNINSLEVLSDIAMEVLENDSASVERAVNAMQDESLKEHVISKDRHAKFEMGIRGVPFFVIERNDGENPIKFSGAQPTDIISEQLAVAARGN